MQVHARFTRLALATALVFGASLPLAALAAEQPATQAPAKAPPMFTELDKNKDGTVDQAEAKKSATVTGDFKKIDANNDGKISLKEWLAHEEATKAGKGAAGPTGMGGSEGMTKPDHASPMPEQKGGK